MTICSLFALCSMQSGDSLRIFAPGKRVCMRACTRRHVQEDLPLFLSRLQLSTIPPCVAKNQHAGLWAACHVEMAPCIYATFTRWLACAQLLACPGEHRASVKHKCSLRCIVAPLPPKEKRATFAGMAEEGLCVPSSSVVLMSESSGEDRCSEEIKAAAFPRPVHLRWYLHSLPKWHHDHLLRICTTRMCFT